MATTRCSLQPRSSWRPIVETLTLIGGLAINGTGNATANSITGNNVANTLNGGLGNDILDGGIGNDKLFGGAGNDRLTGGANADAFVFNTALNASTNRDAITDFSHVDDTFHLENAIFTKLGAGVHALNPAVLPGRGCRGRRQRLHRLQQGERACCPTTPTAMLPAARSRLPCSPTKPTIVGQ